MEVSVDVRAQLSPSAAVVQTSEPYLKSVVSPGATKHLAGHAPSNVNTTVLSLFYDCFLRAFPALSMTENFWAPLIFFPETVTSAVSSSSCNTVH